MGKYDSIIKDFVNSIKPSETSSPSRFYGVVVKKNEDTFVKLDGSSELTPVVMGVSALEGERVEVQIINHVATIVANMDYPADSVISMVEQPDKHVNAYTGFIDNLVSKDAYIEKLGAGIVTAKSIDTAFLNAEEAEIEKLQSNFITAKSINTAFINADKAELDNISAKIISADRIKTAVSEVGYLTADEADMKFASIERITTVEGNITNLTSKAITTDNLTAKVADLGYAKADLLNVEEADIQNAFIKSGYINRVISETGAFTDWLDAVKINADTIDAGTLAVDRLIIKGEEDSILFKLNEGSAVTEKITKQDLENYLHGEHIIANTITATQINVEDLIVNGLINTNKLKAKNIDVEDLFSQNITAKNMDIRGGSIYISTEGSESSSIIELERIDASGNNFTSIMKPDEIVLHKVEANCSDHTIIEPGVILIWNNTTTTNIGPYQVRTTEFVEDGTSLSSKYLGINAKASSATSADSATKATQDGSGNVITSTYALKSKQQYKVNNNTYDVNWSSYATENTTDTWVPVLVNGAVQHRYIPADAKFTDTTYSSKAAASGGTDVSLVTTGEKATWNAKTSNTGTVTSVSVKMNGASKGTVTSSGTIDLGTVVTSHQDISGKLNTSSAPAVSCYKSTSEIKITSANNTYITPFHSQVYCTSSITTRTSNGVIKVNRAGYYRIQAQIMPTARGNVASAVYFYFYKGTSTTPSSNTTALAPCGFGSCGALRANTYEAIHYNTVAYIEKDRYISCAITDQSGSMTLPANYFQVIIEYICP